VLSVESGWARSTNQVLWGGCDEGERGCEGLCLGGAALLRIYGTEIGTGTEKENMKEYFFKRNGCAEVKENNSNYANDTLVRCEQS